MRRWLFVALAAVLAVGALLDATVHREAAGGETLGQQRRDLVAGTDAAVDRTVPTLVGTADEWDGRYSLYLAIRDDAPGAVVLVDESVAESEVSRVLIRALGAAGDVRSVSTGGVTSSELGPPQRRGRYRYGPWSLWTGSGPVGELLVVDDGDTVLLVDSTLLDPDRPGRLPTPAGAATTARDADQPPALTRAAVVESAILALLLMIGGLLIPRRGQRRPMRILLALPVGLGLQASVGLLRLPGVWGFIATAILAGLVGVALQRRGTRVGWDRDDLPLLLVAGTAIAMTVAWARWTTFLILTPDSRAYWAGGAVLADGNLSAALLDVKRGLSLQSLHAIGFAGGIEGLQALGAVLLAVTAALIVALTGRGGPMVGLALAVGLVVSPQVQRFAAYLNTHLLVALLLLALVVLLTHQRADHPDGRLPAIAAVTAAIVLSRAEGALLVGLVLLGTLAASGNPQVLATRLLPGPWRTAGAATLAWAALLAAGPLSAGRPVSLVVGVLAVIGALFVVVPLILRGRSHHIVARAPALVLGVLWAGALTPMFAVEGVDFVDAAIANLGRGAGGWGVTGPLLLVVAVVGVAITGSDRRAMVMVGRWFLLGFIPVTLFAKLGDGLADGASLTTLLSGGGRIGFGDSVNRMWLHAVPLTVVLLALAATSGQEVRNRRFAARVLLVGALLIGIAATWQPQHLPREQEEARLIHRVSTSGAALTPGLVDGSSIDQRILVDPFLPPAGGVVTAVCAHVPLVTFGRAVAGEVVLGLSGGGESTRRSIRGAVIADFGREPVCLSAGPDGPDALAILEDLRLTVGASGSTPGAAAGLLLAESAGPPATLDIPGDPAGGRRQDRVVALDVRVVVERPIEGLGRLVDGAAILLPWVAGFLGFAAFLTPAPRRLDDRSGTRQDAKRVR